MNSGPEHWQTQWERAHPEYLRIHQRDWDAPEPRDWARCLDKAIRASSTPPVLVAHSLGCIAIARWAAEYGEHASMHVSAAMLVAPADVDAEACPTAVRGFRPVPLSRLHFATT